MQFVRGVFRLAVAGEQPAAVTSGGENSVLQVVFALVPTEALTLYHYAKAQLAAQPIDPRMIVAAWIILVLTIALRLIGTLPRQGKGQPEWDVVIIAAVAFILIVLMDGGAFYVGGAVPDGWRPIVAIVAAAGTAILTAWRAHRAAQ
jgi:hypothetical protein